MMHSIILAFTTNIGDNTKAVLTAIRGTKGVNMKAEFRAIAAVFNEEIEVVTETQYKWEDPELNKEMFNEVLNRCIRNIRTIEDGFRVSAQIGYFDENGRYTFICRMFGKPMIYGNTITIQTDEKTITIPA